MPTRKVEFNEYASQYDEFLKDPIRDRFAAGAEFFHRRKLLLIQEYLKSQGLNPKQLAWLDVGCGRGELLALGNAVFGRVAGCDVSQEMMASCGGFETRVQTSPGRIPFEAGSFDLVTAVCVYHHIPPEERAAMTREAARVLKPGGVLGIIEHNPFNPVTRLIVSRTPVDANALLLRPSQTRGILKEAGLPTTQTRFFLYFPESLYAKLGALEGALAGVPLGGQYAVFALKQRYTSYAGDYA